ncbi:MAG: DUF6049 family protein, partial [Acidimicrobiales bacterium]
MSTLEHLPPSTHQIAASPYVPIDLPALTDPGLGGEVTAQLNRGGQVLTSTAAVKPDNTTWITTGGLSSSALAQLQSMAVTHVVVPESDLTPYTGKLTLTQPFGLSGRPGYQPEAASADSGLGAHFTNGGDPVLLAHQMLADLAVIYFDQPGDPNVRSVAAQAPLNWTPNAQFLNSLLSGLASSPIVAPVTLGSVFGHGQSSGSPSPRRIAGGAAAALPAGPIRSLRQRLVAFSSVVDGNNLMVDSMGDSLLVAESNDLRAAVQGAYLSSLRSRIDAQLAQVSLVQDRTITLTASNGRIPITIVSNAPYTIHAVLTVASDKLRFPHGASQPVKLAPHDNARYVDVQSRASGDFPMHVSL